MTILTLLFLSEILILYLGFCSGLSSSNKVAKKTTITVCTGPDCRVDGASDCLRQLQKSVAANNAPIRVTGRNCIGPCGDGPCVMVLNAENEKVVEKQDSKVAISVAPPDLFASDPKGWYQVRTAKQVDEVMEIACKSANVPYETSINESRSDELIVQSTRQIYDRPRNERKVLQRLMQVMVLAGFYGVDEPGNIQYGIAVALFVLSNFIMKENLLGLFWDKMKK